MKAGLGVDTRAYWQDPPSAQRRTASCDFMKCANPRTTEHFFAETGLCSHTTASISWHNHEGTQLFIDAFWERHSRWAQNHRPSLQAAAVGFLPTCAQCPSRARKGLPKVSWGHGWDLILDFKPLHSKCRSAAGEPGSCFYSCAPKLNYWQVWICGHSKLLGPVRCRLHLCLQIST